MNRVRGIAAGRILCSPTTHHSRGTQSQASTPENLCATKRDLPVQREKEERRTMEQDGTLCAPAVRGRDSSFPAGFLQVVNQEEGTTPSSILLSMSLNRVPMAVNAFTVNSTPTNTARTELHSMIAFHHANTHGLRASKLRIAHLCAP